MIAVVAHTVTQGRKIAVAAGHKPSEFVVITELNKGAALRGREITEVIWCVAREDTSARLREEVEIATLRSNH